MTKADVDYSALWSKDFTDQWAIDGEEVTQADKGVDFEFLRAPKVTGKTPRA